MCVYSSSIGIKNNRRLTREMDHSEMIILFKRFTFNSQKLNFTKRFEEHKAI